MPVVAFGALAIGALATLDALKSVARRVGASL